MAAISKFVKKKKKKSKTEKNAINETVAVKSFRFIITKEVGVKHAKH